MSVRQRTARAASLVASVSIGATILLAPSLQAQERGGPDLGPPPGGEETVPGPKRSLPPGGEKRPGQRADKAPAPEQKKRRAGDSIPETAAKRALLLDELYTVLATAADEDQAKRITAAIEQIWLIPNSATVSVLIDRAGRAVAEKKVDVARQLYDRAVKIAPDYPEVFLRRAYFHHSQNDVALALADLRRAVALDPNHYKALEALGQMLREIGQQKASLAVFRKVLEVNPFTAGLKPTVDELTRDVEGQGI